jgi:hypothetical protein
MSNARYRYPGLAALAKSNSEAYEALAEIDDLNKEIDDLNELIEVMVNGDEVAAP